MQNKERELDKALDKLLGKLFGFNAEAEDTSIKRKHFHIAITDNDTGKIICDDETDCIIGAYDHSSKGTASMGFSNCDIVKLCATCAGARRMVDKMTENNPLAKLMLAAVKSEE